MDERDQKRQLVDAKTEGTGRLRGGVEMVQAGAGRARLAAESVGWLLRERIAWPIEDAFERLGTRGAIGVFGGGGIALAGVVAVLALASSGGSGTGAPTLEAFVTPRTPAPVAASAKPRRRAQKPAGPTLHGAPPDFSPAKDVRAGVGSGRALRGKRDSGASKASTAQGAAGDGTGGAAAGAPASTAKIGATPGATVAARAQASSLAPAGKGKVAGAGDELTGPPAPKAAKKVARRFAEAFVVYEVGGIDGKVREAFDQTGTKQLSRSLLHRPPRQPAGVEVPQAKVVNVVAGPSRGSVYTVSVSLLRVGVTSELRLEMERGVSKKWQVTNVLG